VNPQLRNERSCYYLFGSGPIEVCLGKNTRKSNAPTRGEETRGEIVDHAMRVAAVEGLGAISIGRLAKELKMSKSGLFVHFGSKEQLERAVVERAHDTFFGRVLLPAEDVEPGIARVWTLCDYWLEFSEHGALPGGYFFTGAFFERAEQDGPIARRIRDIADEWCTVLRRAIDEARNREEIRREVDAKRTAFELNSLLIGAHLCRLLVQKDLTGAHSAVLRKLQSAATEEIPAEVFESVRDWKKYLEGRRK
jgi:AcrR family transcriptional regulator